MDSIERSLLNVIISSRASTTLQRSLLKDFDAVIVLIVSEIARNIIINPNLTTILSKPTVLFVKKNIRLIKKFADQNSSSAVKIRLIKQNFRKIIQLLKFFENLYRQHA